MTQILKFKHVADPERYPAPVQVFWDEQNNLLELREDAPGGRLLKVFYLAEAEVADGGPGELDE